MFYVPEKGFRISKSRTHYYMEIYLNGAWLVLHSATRYTDDGEITVKLSGFKKLSTILKKYKMWLHEAILFSTDNVSLSENKRLKPIDTGYINKVCPEYSF